MNRYTSKYFGEIDLDAVEEGYDAEIEYKGRTVSLDLNIVGATKIESANIKAVDDFLNNLDQYEPTLRSALKKDLKEKGETDYYLQEHIEELGKAQINNLMISADKKGTKKEQLLSVVYLKRIGLYPEEEDETLAIFDYTLSKELTDELLVVNITKDWKIKEITVES
ncbi:DUF2004 domain-containing protein [Rhodocytophaga aerolata]|uniref:DUF2004 domain-containing protein n=1 Tax=Rhodocytophaga aerolata TaxID=455078 RepID=A0ABT8RKF5_9BACT|nr:DUF2004 domain-containing protein [Rhodocytophaga aerolata]MDO1451853.1 DUF2004 domain-containing protein [Rhodocytophaga aerolata]